MSHLHDIIQDDHDRYSQIASVDVPDTRSFFKLVIIV